jgi:hypothetical protein
MNAVWSLLHPLIDQQIVEISLKQMSSISPCKEVHKINQLTSNGDRGSLIFIGFEMEMVWQPKCFYSFYSLV